MNYLCCRLVEFFLNYLDCSRLDLFQLYYYLHLPRKTVYLCSSWPHRPICLKQKEARNPYLVSLSMPVCFNLLLPYFHLNLYFPTPLSCWVDNSFNMGFFKVLPCHYPYHYPYHHPYHRPYHYPYHHRFHLRFLLLDLHQAHHTCRQATGGVYWLNLRLP